VGSLAHLSIDRHKEDHFTFRVEPSLSRWRKWPGKNRCYQTSTAHHELIADYDDDDDLIERGLILNDLTHVIPELCTANLSLLMGLTHFLLVDGHEDIQEEKRKLNLRLIKTDVLPN
jgi:hypothetical protein